MMHQQEDSAKKDLPPVDLVAFPAAQKLATRSKEFLFEIQNRTPGKDLEILLNKNFGPGTTFYDDFAALIRQGFEEGWVADHEVDGPQFRAGKIMLPMAENLYVSLHAVYYEAGELIKPANSHHSHPYGEINCVIPIDKSFQLEGLPVDQNWQGAGWTSLAAGTHHWPRARGGRGFAFFFLPSGRIDFAADPNAPQPLSV